MSLASTSVLGGECSPQNVCQQHLSLWESHLPSASLGDSPRSASISDSGYIQITASALGFSACDILHAPFKSKSVSYKPQALLYASTAGLQSHTF